MFDQDQDQQTTNTNDSSAFIVGSTDNTAAPGAPIGPLDQDPAGDHPLTAPTADSQVDEPMDDQSAAQPAANDVTELPTSPTTDSTAPAAMPSDELLSIKQDALHELSPLVDQLEQSPEEKFRTTMMMIQASDDQGLIKAAYDAAKQITDEKARAQALLDVVNEINYFTQQHNS